MTVPWKTLIYNVKPPERAPISACPYTQGPRHSHHLKKSKKPEHTQSKVFSSLHFIIYTRKKAKKKAPPSPLRNFYYIRLAEQAKHSLVTHRGKVCCEIVCSKSASSTPERFRSTGAWKIDRSGILDFSPCAWRPMASRFSGNP